MGRSPDLDHAVVRQLQAAALRPFLQRGLGIPGRGQHRGQPPAPAALDQALGRRQPAIPIDRPDQRLETVGERRRLRPPAGILLAPSEHQKAAEIELEGDLGQGLAAHQPRMPLGQRALALARKAGHQQVGDREGEHAIAEELQALVAALATAPVGGRAAVGQSLAQQRRIGEAVADRALELDGRRGA